MRRSRPSFRVKTPPPPASRAEVGVPADAGLTTSKPNTAFLLVGPPPASRHQPPSATHRKISVKTSSAHPSLIGLARLLGRQAARDWLVGGGEGGSDE